MLNELKQIPGAKNTAIADAIGVSRQTIQRWLDPTKDTDTGIEPGNMKSLRSYYGQVMRNKPRTVTPVDRMRAEAASVMAHISDERMRELHVPIMLAATASLIERFPEAINMAERQPEKDAGTS